MNEVEVRRTLELFKPNVIRENGEIYERIIEIRVIDGKKIYSGYYTLPYIDKLIEDIKPYDNANIYFVLNEVKRDCYAKKQRNKLLLGEENTKDNEIDFRTHILIDLDAKRISKVSSTDEEKRYSQLKANQIYRFLSQQGFSKPIVADSGNGVHLLYNISLSCTPENDAMINDFLYFLAYKFSDDFVDVDVKVGNRARITKLYGTMARKGANTPDRPHRESKIIKVPQEIKPTPLVVIKRVADMLPQPEAPSYDNNYGHSNFNLREFIAKHNISIAKESACSDGVKFVLEKCPFCGNAAPDSALFLRGNGAIGFFCFHNSCADKKWKDFRLFYEPNAYNKQVSNNYQYNNKFKLVNNTPIVQVPKNEVTDEKGDIWENFIDIQDEDRSNIVSIPSGIIKIDSAVYGFDKKNVIIWSGSNGSGKSSLLNEICLNAVNNGFSGRIWSGELNKSRLKKWLYLQAAGKQYTKQSQFNPNDYYITNNVKPLIGEWLRNKLMNYNTKYSNNLQTIIDEIKKEHERNPFDFCVLDNLMVLDIDIFAGDKNDKQTKAIWELHKLAEDLDIVIHIVIHPRKPMGFIRKTDICGSSNLANAADAIYIVHRINRDFDRQAPEFLTQFVVDDLHTCGATNIIECVKHREFGTFEGEIVKLFYQLEDKRFLNERYEHWEYKWNDSTITQSSLDNFTNSNNDFSCVNIDDWDDLPM